MPNFFACDHRLHGRIPFELATRLGNPIRRLVRHFVRNSSSEAENRRIFINMASMILMYNMQEFSCVKHFCPLAGPEHSQLVRSPDWLPKSANALLSPPVSTSSATCHHSQ